MSYAEVKALATGNPLLLELAEANADVTPLRQLAAGHTRATRRLTHSVARWEQQITAKTQLAADCDLIASTTRNYAAESWRDQRGNPIPGQDAAAHLAHLVSQAMTSDDGYRAARLCGLTISFRTQRQWRKVTPVAAISYGGTSLAVELNPAWTSRGQYWRIEKEITTAIGNLRTSDLSAGRVMSVLVVS